MKVLIYLIAIFLFFCCFTANSQDIILLKNGDEIESKVIEIAPSVIKYKKTANLDGPVYHIEKAKIFMIKFEDGTKEIFDNEPSEASIPKESSTYRIEESPVIENSISKNRFGIKVGINLTNLATRYNDSSVNTEYKIRPAYHIGVVGDFHLSDNLGLRPELLFSSKGASVDADFDDGDYVRWIINYLELSLNVRYSIAAIDVFAGPYFGIGIGGKRTLSFSGNDSETDIIYRASSVDLTDLDEEGFFQQLLDLGFNIGVSYNISESIGISGAYGIGLRNVNLSVKDGTEIIFNAEDIQRFNRVISISFQYFFSN